MFCSNEGAVRIRRPQIHPRAVEKLTSGTICRELSDSDQIIRPEQVATDRRPLADLIVRRLLGCDDDYDVFADCGVVGGSCSSSAAPEAGLAAGGIVESVGTAMKHRLIALVLVREIDGLVVAQGEVDVTDHLASAGVLAFDADCESVAVALLVRDDA